MMTTDAEPDNEDGMPIVRRTIGGMDTGHAITTVKGTICKDGVHVWVAAKYDFDSQCPHLDSRCDCGRFRFRDTTPKVEARDASERT